MNSYRYCPCCAGTLKKKRIDHGSRLICTKCGFIFYRNSKPCVAAVILKGKKILLTQRGIEPYRGDWDLPGGFLEYGEAPEAGLKRELKEELGLKSRIRELLLVGIDRYGAQGEFTMSLYYLVTPIGKMKAASDDVSAYRFFPLNKPPKNIAFPSVRKVLARLRRR